MQTRDVTFQQVLDIVEILSLERNRDSAADSGHTRRGVLSLATQTRTVVRRERVR